MAEGMDDEGPRYAVYFVPTLDSSFYRFGSAVLQYDCFSGVAVPPPDDFTGDSDGWRKATEEPRRYGFHATLKAPFRLSSRCTEAQLVSAFESFAALGRAAISVKPVVQMLSGFTAILPDKPAPAVNALAGDCTTIFDAFRAPMSARERAKRLASGLNHSQIQNLDRWGYPYLFSDFRFHMTLTGKIATGRRDTTLETLQSTYRRICGDQRMAIDRLALMKQDSPQAFFRVLRHVPLQGC